MFRLLAAALVTTFAILGIVGTVGNTPQSHPAALLPLPPSLTAQPPETALGAFKPGARFLAPGELTLHTRPDPESEIAAHLIRGAPVVMLAPAEMGFARVKAEGQTGYVTAASLTLPPG